MAFRRKRRAFNRFKKRPRTLFKLNKKVDRLKRELKPELKFAEDELQTALTTAGANTFMSSVPQGTDVFERVGDKIRARGINIRYLLNNIGVTQAYARVIVFVWKDDTVPVVTDILSASATTDTIGQYNYYNKGAKYKILYDRTEAFGRDFVGGSTTASDRVNVVRHKNIKFNHMVHYDGITGNDQLTNKIYLLTVATSTNCNIDITWTYFWHDL